MMTTGMLRKVATRSARDNYSELMLSAPLIGLIAVRDRYDQDQCLQAGRVWQRAHLLATARGLAARPSNEAVEMVDHERALGSPASREALLSAITDDRTWQPTFVFIYGLSQPVSACKPTAAGAGCAHIEKTQPRASPPIGHAKTGVLPRSDDSNLITRAAHTCASPLRSLPECKTT